MGLRGVQDMDLINNRFRVLELLNQSYLTTSYVVSDISRGYKVKRLNIINIDNVQKEAVKFLADNFISLKNANNKNIINLYEFDLMTNVDNKQLKEYKYFYTTEHCESYSNTINLAKANSDESKLDLFAQVCKSINTLHLKGFICNYINNDSIYLNNKQTNDIKVMDLASAFLKSFHWWNLDSSESFFRAQELNKDKNGTVRTDIYSLGALLLKFFNLESCALDNLEEKKAVSPNESFNEKLTGIVVKAMNKNPSARYSSINELISDINLKFQREYNSVEIEHIEKLNFKTPLVDRDYPQIEVEDVFNKLICGGRNIKWIGVHGEIGIGKSRFLKEIKQSLKMKEINVLSEFFTVQNDSNPNQVPINIFKHMLSLCDKEIMDKYNEELLKFMPELLLIPKPSQSSKFILQQKEKYRLLNRFSGLIKAISHDRPIAFIIDNINLAHPFFIEALEFLHMEDIPNIMVLFSYDDSFYNHNIIDMITKFKNKDRYVDIKLNPLSIEDTSLMIKNIMCLPREANDFGKTIYSKTYGNPLFIVEVIKNLFSRKDIYIDAATGIWSTDYEIKDIPVPVNLEQAMLNQISEISSEGREVLTTISVFNDAVGVEALSKVMKIEIEKVEALVGDLVKKGLLLQKINDRGFVFDFYNKILKRMLYENLREEERKIKHEAIARVLEESLIEINSEYKDELIYHLEKAERKEKLLKYCLEIADRFEKLNIHEVAIESLERAVSALNFLDDERVPELLLRLSRLYKKIGNIDGAVDKYKETLKAADKLHQNIFGMQAYCGLAEIYLDKGEIEGSIKYLNLGEKAVENLNFMEGNLYIDLIWAQIYLVKRVFEKAFNICNASIDKCGVNHAKYKGKFMHVIGMIYYSTGKISKAMESFEKAIAYFKDINYLDGTAKALNNIGVIYGDFYQNDEKALEYFLSVKDICERNLILESAIPAIINIGEIYFKRGKYEQARSYLEDGLEKGKKLYQQNTVFYCFVYLTNINLIMYNYRDAYDYYMLANNELKQHPEQGTVLADYYRVSGGLLCEFGAAKKALNFIRKAIEGYGENESTLKWNAEFTEQIIKLRLSEEYDEADKITSRIYGIASRFEGLENKIGLIYNSALELLDKGYNDLARSIIRDFGYDVVEEQLYIKRMFLEEVLFHGGDRIESLNKLLDIAVKSKSNDMQWRICCIIGDYYLKNQNYIYAAKLYFDACEVVKELTLLVPEKFRVDYVNFHNMKKPFEKLYRIKQHYDGRNMELSCNLPQLKTIKDLNVFFDYTDLKDILTNKEFIASAQEIYDYMGGNKIKSIKEIVANLVSDPISNLDIIIRYLYRTTLAKGVSIIKEENNNYKVLVDTGAERKSIENKYILDIVRKRRKPVFVTELGSSDSDLNIDVIEGKAVICVPIFSNKQLDHQEVIEERRGIFYTASQILGYLYVDSDNIFNNINKETYRLCKRLSPLIALMLEKLQLEISSSIDNLTGVYTRKYLEDFLENQIQQSKENGQNFSIIMFDIDDFKGVNDKFGHQTGDRVLKELSSIVRSNIRKVDMCGRYGGEEFIVILPGTDIEGTSKVSSKLRELVEASKLLGDIRPVTISMGIAAYPQHGNTAAEIIEKADQALYVAKERGRNRYQVWKKEFSGKMKRTGRMSGVITGNAIRDHRNVSVMIELVDLIKKEDTLENKIYSLLGRVIEITEAQQGTIFIIVNDEVISKHSRRAFEEGWMNLASYNNELLNTVIRDKQGIAAIDWDEISEYDILTGIPDWKSIIMAPIIEGGTVKAVLSLSVSTKMKEFKFNDLNFVSVLGQIVVPMFM
jgi:diguanylate cyclase (GGDEF)-like protein